MLENLLYSIQSVAAFLSANEVFRGHWEGAVVLFVASVLAGWCADNVPEHDNENDA